MNHETTDWIAIFSDGPKLSLWQMREDQIVARTGADFDTDPEALIVGCGFSEVALRDTPCAPLPDVLPINDIGGRAMHLVPAIRTTTPLHHSAGAELAIAGFVALNPRFDGVLCIPGATTIWAHISAEEVVSLQGFATQKLADALGASDVDALDMDVLSDVMTRPARLAERIASAQVGDAAHVNPTIVSALIGAEMAAARPYWLGQQVAVLDGSPLTALYEAAITAQGLAPIQANGAAMRQKGLLEARARIAD